MLEKIDILFRQSTPFLIYILQFFHSALILLQRKAWLVDRRKIAEYYLEVKLSDPYVQVEVSVNQDEEVLGTYHHISSSFPLIDHLEILQR